jgi:hypothetical protein
VAGRVCAGFEAVESEFELFVGCHNFVLITTPLSQGGLDKGCPSLVFLKIILRAGMAGIY